MIDPIDGTKAYVSGMPLWGVLLGLIVDGRPVAGWCRQPYLDETFAAIAGTGWLDHAGRRQALRTRSTTDLADATMYSTHPEHVRRRLGTGRLRGLDGRGSGSSASAATATRTACWRSGTWIWSWRPACSPTTSCR